MRRWSRWLCIATLLGVAAGPVARAQDESREPPPDERGGDAREQTERQAPVATETVVYVPPPRGAPRARTGGGTRAPTELPRLEVLAPEHVGRTARASPTLSWYVSEPAPVPLELTLLREGANEPELEVTLASEAQAGIGEAPLSRWDVELEPGVVYQWSVALVADPARRDRDVVATGAIERVVASPAVAAALASGADGYRVLAREGIWYDALAELGRAIVAGDASLHAQRADLLDQVGLSESAAFERRASGPR